MRSAAVEGVGDRLRGLRGDMSQADFGELLGVSLSTWRRYEAGERPPDAEALLKLHLLKGIDLHWLLTGNGQPVPKGSMPQTDYALVPYFDVTAAAGHGRTVLDAERPAKQLAYRHDWLHARNLSASNLFEISVAGDSMESELRDGDTVLVDRSQTEIRGGAIYVLRVGEELVIKYLQRLPGGRVQVSSENRDAYPSYEVAAEHFASGEVEVLGRVVRQGRDR